MLISIPSLQTTYAPIVKLCPVSENSDAVYWLDESGGHWFSGVLITDSKITHMLLGRYDDRAFREDAGDITQEITTPDGTFLAWEKDTPQPISEYLAEFGWQVPGLIRQRLLEL